MQIDKPARRWRFQIHLSTAIVMMFAAGGIIWANTRDLDDVQSGMLDGYGITEQHCGWPFTAIEFFQWPRNPSHIEERSTEWFFHKIQAAFNAVTTAAILFMVWYVCERRARNGVFDI